MGDRCALSVLLVEAELRGPAQEDVSYIGVWIWDRGNPTQPALPIGSSRGVQSCADTACALVHARGLCREMLQSAWNSTGFILYFCFGPAYGPVRIRVQRAALHGIPIP